MQNSFEQIKLLNLTDEGFKLMVDGLDALPERGAAGEMMGELLIGILSKGDEEKERQMKLERDDRRRKAEKDKESIRENVKILQGKLLILKRYLQENNALAQTYEVLNIPKHQ